MSHIPNPRRSLSKDCHTGQSLSGVADIIHIDLNPLQRPSLNGDALGIPRDFTSHFLECLDKANVSLQSVRRQSFYGHHPSGHRGDGKKITGGRCIRLNVTVATTIRLRNDVESPRLWPFHRNSKFRHHFQCHFDVGFRDHLPFQSNINRSDGTGCGH